MAGHSKWSTIKRKKGKLDAQRAKVFTKIGREMMVAVKLAGADPDMNPRLKMAIAKAKSANMPNDNIKRVIAKASGDEDGANYENISYEGYGQGGAAIIVDVLTDNRNRTAGEVRHAFDKYGGNMGESGCVSYMFNTKGVIEIKMAAGEEEAKTMMAIEAGAEDIVLEEDRLLVYTAMEDLETVRERLKKETAHILSSRFEKIPDTTVDILDLDQAQSLIDLMEALEDNDDVQETWSNFNIDEDLAAKLD